MKTKFREIIGKAGNVVFLYPMVLVIALLTSVGAIYMAETNYSDKLLFTYSKITMCCGLGISLLFALKMLSQRIGKAFLLEICGVIFLIGFYFVFPDEKKEFIETYGYIIAITFLLSHLLVSFVPFLDKNRELSFWQYNKNLFVNIFLTVIFTGVLTGGVELAVLAVDKLFDFDFNDKLYADLFFVLAIFGSCFIFLLFNEIGLSYLEKDGKYPVILKFFTQFILIPLLFIYVIILYFYSFKILINWQLPRGWVSYLVLAYSIVGILALLLVHPLKENNTKSWVKIFSKVFYFTIIPLIILLFTAIFTRILEYGYTEPRYFVLLLALWLLSIVIYFVFKKNSSIKFVPISLFAFGVFALIFPYLNAFSVAKRSQKSELLKLLNEKQLLSNNKIDFQKKVTDTIVNEIGDKFEFLAERKQADFLLNLLDTKKNHTLENEIKVNPFLSLRYSVQSEFTNTNRTITSGYERLSLESEKQYITIDSYQYFFNLRNYNDDTKEINGDKFNITERSDKGIILKVDLNSKEEADFTPGINNLFKEYSGRKGVIKLPEISFEKDLGKYHIKVVFLNISNDKSPYNKSGAIYYDNAVLLIKEK
ncbi:DUF4153 domain-containing protein [Chryseobacterium limigenitum]|uniref:DUF4153 domain-containing protein n=1 Tax=Chryseobacterium limigenitum TaxID=1612149 RepID=A0A1K2IDJ9_9FLAO|nr:DUF4153 domain-containing protein [Chryseobacterium limigenitum]SFZ90463.1 protein of unknown function [Chryseobacterium limigenitum]